MNEKRRGQTCPRCKINMFRLFSFKKKKSEKVPASSTEKTKRNTATGTKATEKTRPLVSVQIKNHKDVKGGHPHVVLEDIDDKHVSVGLTTKPKKGKNATNYKLEVSPLGDGRQSYARRQGTVAPRKEYEKPRKGNLTTADYTRIKSYGEKAKQKYIEKKSKKK